MMMMMMDNGIGWGWQGTWGDSQGQETPPSGGLTNYIKTKNIQGLTTKSLNPKSQMDGKNSPSLGT
jgi:hypothetical protein